jgi:hypothetical protein
MPRSHPSQEVILREMHQDTQATRLRCCISSSFSFNDAIIGSVGPSNTTPCSKLFRHLEVFYQWSLHWFYSLWYHRPAEKKLVEKRGKVEMRSAFDSCVGVCGCGMSTLLLAWSLFSLALTLSRSSTQLVRVVVCLLYKNKNKTPQKESIIPLS